MPSPYVTITGTILDPNGVRWINAHMIITYIAAPTATLAPTLGNPYLIFPMTVVYTEADAMGRFSVILPNNCMVQDGHAQGQQISQWAFRISSSYGYLPRVAFQWMGSLCASQDITSLLQASSVPLPPLGGGGGGPAEMQLNLFTVGSTGPASLDAAGNLNIPIYQGQIVVTSLPGSPSLMADVLNIPPAQEPLIVTSNPGSPSLVGGILNIPPTSAGPTGPAGPAGAAATISVAPVSSLPAGSAPTVSNIGTSAAAVLQFAMGPGATGATGATGGIGPAGPQGPAGTGVDIVGELSDPSLLPSSGNSIGDAYLINGALWVWTPHSPPWVDAGNIQGPAGSQGNPGAPGTAATISVAPNVTSLPAGSAPTVSNTGTASAAVLQFAMGPGATGATGSAGAAATVTVDPTVTTLAPGAVPTVTNTGTTSAAVLKFSMGPGAQGATGNTGSAGPAGAAATISVAPTVSPLPAGSAPTVSNTGSSSAAVLQFAMGPGATGATGSIGPQGPVGVASAVLPLVLNSGSLYINPTGANAGDGLVFNGSLWQAGPVPAPVLAGGQVSPTATVQIIEQFYSSGLGVAITPSQTGRVMIAYNLMFGATSEAQGIAAIIYRITGSSSVPPALGPASGTGIMFTRFPIPTSPAIASENWCSASTLDMGLSKTTSYVYHLVLTPALNQAGSTVTMYGTSAAALGFFRVFEV